MTSFSGSAETNLGKSDRVALREGQSFKAPKEGHFLSKEALAKLVAEYKAKIKLLEEKVANQKKQHETEKKANERAREIERSACVAQLENSEKNCSLQKMILEKSVDRNAKLAERKWYESPWVPFLGGVAVCAGSVITGASLK